MMNKKWFKIALIVVLNVVVFGGAYLYFADVSFASVATFVVNLLTRFYKVLVAAVKYAVTNNEAIIGFIQLFTGRNAENENEDESADDSIESSETVNASLASSEVTEEMSKSTEFTITLTNGKAKVTTPSGLTIEMEGEGEVTIKD